MKKKKTIYIILIIALVGVITYTIWTPGKIANSGDHNLKTNGIWLQHGWLGDDKWFAKTGKDKTLFRDQSKIYELAKKLEAHNIRDIYPHLCPCSPTGRISSVDHKQTERFLTYFSEFRVMPWIGGRLNVHCFPESEKWRKAFIASAKELLTAYPGLAGIHINIEPMPSGNKDFLLLLNELKNALPEGKLLSIAAYPPPSLLQPAVKVHWEEDYFKTISSTVDQMAVMMYDTALQLQKVYQNLMASWTEDVLLWGGDSKILLGVPVYDDFGVAYHTPRVENLKNSLLGINAGLSRFEKIPPCYQGIAIYSEWEMDSDEWVYLKNNFTGE